MRVNPTLLGWGVFLILLGGIPLAVRQGLLDEAMVSRAWTIWPLLLVAAGVGLLLRRTPFEMLGGLLAAATFGIIGGSLLASGGLPFGGCGDERGATPFRSQTGDLGSAGAVEVGLNCGDLTIATTRGARWSVEGADEDGSGPEISSAPGRVEIRDRRHAPFAFGGSRSRWQVLLGTSPTIDLAVSINAGAARLDLHSARLGRLDVEVNAGEATVDLGALAAIGRFDLHLNAGQLTLTLPATGSQGAIEANAASVKLCRPSGAGLRIATNDNITASNNLGESGFVERSKNVWESPDFAAATTRIELGANVNAGSIELQPEGACGG